MSFTRKFLKTMGLTDEQVDAVIEEHIAVTTGLKDDLNRYKSDAEKVQDMQAQIDSLTAERDQLKAEKEDNEDWKAKFDEEHAGFDKYKQTVEAERNVRNIKDLYRSMLKEQNIDDKRVDAILKVTDFSGMKVAKDGKLDGADKLAETIKTEWKDFIVSHEKRGAEVETPPSNTGGSSLTKADIMAIKDTTERQKAIADNPKLFGLE